jgi:hypothetical protein
LAIVLKMRRYSLHYMIIIIWRFVKPASYSSPHWEVHS